MVLEQISVTNDICVCGWGVALVFDRQTFLMTFVFHEGGLSIGIRLDKITNTET